MKNFNENDWKVAPYRVFIVQRGYVDVFAIWKRVYKFSWSKLKYLPTNEFERYTEEVSFTRYDEVIEHLYKKEENAQKELDKIVAELKRRHHYKPTII